MAFGFIRKILNFFGKKAKDQKNRGKRRGDKGRAKNRNGRDKNRQSRENAVGKDQKKARNQQGKGNKQQQHKDATSKQNANGQRQQRREENRNNIHNGEERRNERRNGENRNGERRRDGSRRGPAPVNTAANEMRPGGVITAEEQARRAQAHAAWNPESFVVEPVEGKKRFHDFNLPGEVLHGISDLGFKYCTEIQALSLQNALDGKNIAGKAQTGSGKTAAFLVAILTRYLRTPESRAKVGGNPRALVIAPTRELVIQICKDADAIGKYCGLRSLAVYGGMDFERQKAELLDAPVDLLVATPGRLLDFCQRHVINLANVDTLVIDEADRMLDMGFIPDVSRIMSHLPPKNKRATMLYSATLNDDVMNLALRWMEEPVKAEVESEHNATDTVRQVVYVIRAEDKLTVLFNHIALHPGARAIVFCNRKSTTEFVANSLERRGIRCAMLSGDVNQNKRLRVLDDFRSGKVKIVVATDVAGRGIHVDDIEYVINFDFPYEAEDYVHRIGRTGRAGNTGIAISFADEDESFAIPEIEEYIKEPLKCTIIQEDDPLLKPLAKLARGETAKLGEVDEAAKAAVDAREAVTEEQKAAAAAIVGAANTAVATAPETTAPITTETATESESAEEQAASPVKEVSESSTEKSAVVIEQEMPAEVKTQTPPPNSILTKTAAGRESYLRDEAVQRNFPTFEKALEPKAPPKDESKIYSKPVAQKTKFEEWSIDVPAEEKLQVENTSSPDTEAKRES